MQLQNKVAVITGSSLGIGSAIALALAREGAAVAVDYRSHPDEAKQIVDEVAGSGGRAVSVHADVSDPGDVRNLIQRAVEEFGRLDIMINNAGIEEKMPFLETPLDVWNRTIAVNLTGAWLGCQEAARQMVAQGGPGRIINVSSVHEDLPMPTNSPYCAAKGGLRMLTRTIAVELAPHDITVNNIAPGAVDTPMDAPLKGDPDRMQQLLSEIPLQRMGKPEEVAALAVYLASDAAAYVTGSTFVIDGGMMRHSGSL
ncbi:MAG TPA: SDR family oxidoreductase [Rubrobacteraceae bacterium]|nr:SDR family oxidoreductase [Rubrobacteraceae bacterium]